MTKDNVALEKERDRYKSSCEQYENRILDLEQKLKAQRIQQPEQDQQVLMVQPTFLNTL